MSGPAVDNQGPKNPSKNPHHVRQRKEDEVSRAWGNDNWKNEIPVEGSAPIALGDNARLQGLKSVANKTGIKLLTDAHLVQEGELDEDGNFKGYPWIVKECLAKALKERNERGELTKSINFSDIKTAREMIEDMLEEKGMLPPPSWGGGWQGKKVKTEDNEEENEEGNEVGETSTEKDNTKVDQEVGEGDDQLNENGKRRLVLTTEQSRHEQKDKEGDKEMEEDKEEEKREPEKVFEKEKEMEQEKVQDEVQSNDAAPQENIADASISMIDFAHPN